MRARSVSAMTLCATCAWVGIGCIFAVPDAEGGSSRGNHAPWISDDGEDTFWACYHDEAEDEWFFEAQTWVDDPEDFDDVRRVYVEFFDADGKFVDSFDLDYDSDGYWTAWVWEYETQDLYCGEDYDVLFTAVDGRGATDDLWVEH